MLISTTVIATGIVAVIYFLVMLIMGRSGF